MSLLSLPTLEERGNKSKLTTMYKIINRYLVKHTYKLQMILYVIIAHQEKDITNSLLLWLIPAIFFPSVIRLWNALPRPLVIHSSTLDEFCTNLSIHYDYTCAQQSFRFLLHSNNNNGQLVNEWANLNFWWFTKIVYPAIYKCFLVVNMIFHIRSTRTIP